MSERTLSDNWKKFYKLINEIAANEAINNDIVIKRYLEQNIIILNEVLTTSIENLKQLHHADSVNDIICTQARFTNDVTKKLSLSAQRFLNSSLGHIADYNEWLKAHCDLMTD